MCKRCDGSGYIHKWKHIENGVCFACRGVITEPQTTAGTTAGTTRLERLNVYRANRQLKETQRKERLQLSMDFMRINSRY